MNTTENNKLIAEFMILPTEVFKSDKLNYKHNDNWFEEHELSYNVSWDWLMPVVYSILWLPQYEDESYEDIYDGLTNALLSQTYDAVVKFIKEYNERFKL